MKREELLESIKSGDKITVVAEVVMARTALKRKTYKIRVGGYELWIDDRSVVGKGKTE